MHAGRAGGTIDPCGAEPLRRAGAHTPAPGRCSGGEGSTWFWQRQQHCTGPGFRRRGWRTGPMGLTSVTPKCCDDFSPRRAAATRGHLDGPIRCPVGIRGDPRARTCHERRPSSDPSLEPCLAGNRRPEGVTAHRGRHLRSRARRAQRAARTGRGRASRLRNGRTTGFAWRPGETEAGACRQTASVRRKISRLRSTQARVGSHGAFRSPGPCRTADHRRTADLAPGTCSSRHPVRRTVRDLSPLFGAQIRVRGGT